MDYILRILQLFLQAFCDVGEGRYGFIQFVCQLIAIQVSLHDKIAVCVEKEVHIRKRDIAQKGDDTIFDQGERR